MSSQLLWNTANTVARDKAEEPRPAPTLSAREPIGVMVLARHAILRGKRPVPVDRAPVNPAPLLDARISALGRDRDSDL